MAEEKKRQQNHIMIAVNECSGRELEARRVLTQCVMVSNAIHCHSLQNYEHWPAPPGHQRLAQCRSSLLPLCLTPNTALCLTLNLEEGWARTLWQFPSSRLRWRTLLQDMAPGSPIRCAGLHNPEVQGSPCPVPEENQQVGGNWLVKPAPSCCTRHW